MITTAWLLERTGPSGPLWLMICGVFDWTDDANEALKFADEISATDFNVWCGSEWDLRVTEHQWPEGFNGSFCAPKREG